jgi:hypothetical protein
MRLAAAIVGVFIEILTRFLLFDIWIVKYISLTFAVANDDRRERHRSLLHFS